MSEFRPAYFDPLSTVDLTAIICRKFDEQPPHDLKGLPDFEGAGLYAIYYDGIHTALYHPIRGYRIPVYAGSAQSHISATGGGAKTLAPLRRRVGEHERSIDQSTLALADFKVRLLMMPDVHIDLGENGLRVGYKPVWNSVLSGFGSHEQGSKTRTGRQSKWDCVHAGRSRTFGADRSDETELITKVNQLLASQVQACGGGLGLDWTNYDPEAVRIPR